MEKAQQSFYGKKRGNILRFMNECVSDRTDAPNPDSDTAMAFVMDHYLGVTSITERHIGKQLTSILTHV